MPASQVELETVRWLWPGRIPLGGVTVLAGEPGCGKSTLTCNLAARVSRGLPIFSQQPGDLAGPADVLMLCVEDSIGAVVVPRLAAADADLTRIHLLDDKVDAEPVSFPSNIGPVERWAHSADRSALIVIDPVMGLLDPDINSHSDQHVREALRPLHQIAHDTGAATIPVMHFNKNEGASAMNRIGGSTGFPGTARSVLLFGRPATEHRESARRALVSIKSNYGQLPSAMMAKIAVNQAKASFLSWTAVNPAMTEEQILSPGISSSSRETTW